MSSFAPDMSVSRTSDSGASETYECESQLMLGDSAALASVAIIEAEGRPAPNEGRAVQVIAEQCA